MSDLLVSTDDGVCTITFNRPARKNALTVAMYQSAVAALTAAGGRPENIHGANDSLERVRVARNPRAQAPQAARICQRVQRMAHRAASEANAALHVLH